MMKHAMMWALAVMTVVCVGQVFGQWSTDPAVDTALDQDGTDCWGHYCVFDGSGGYFAVWYCSVSGLADIFAQHVLQDGTLDWGADGVTVCTGPSHQTTPKLCLDGAGGILVTWYDQGDSGIHAQRLNADGDLQWAAAGIPVMNGERCGWIVPDGEGGGIVMGENSVVNRIDADGTLLWGDADTPVAVGVTNCSYPKLAPDGAGGAYVLWRENFVEIAVQRVDKDGNLLWNGGAPLELTDTGSGYCPRMVRNGTNGIFVIWSDNSEIRMQSVNAAGVPQWTAPNGITVTADTVDDYDWSLASDKAGGVYVSWGSSANGGIYAQRFNAAGAEVWTAGGVRIADPGDWEWTTCPPNRIIEDGSGGFITIWINTSYDLKAQRVNASGTALWGVDGLEVATAAVTSYRYCARLEGNGQGGAMVMFVDDRVASSDWDLFCKGVTKDGTLGTPAYTAPSSHKSSSSKCGVGGGLLLALAVLGLISRKRD